MLKLTVFSTWAEYCVPCVLYIWKYKENKCLSSGSWQQLAGSIIFFPNTSSQGITCLCINMKLEMQLLIQFRKINFEAVL